MTTPPFPAGPVTALWGRTCGCGRSLLRPVSPALKPVVLNRTEGLVDAMILRLKGLLGRKPVPGNPNFSDGVSPYIWNDYVKLEWYAFHPTPTDYETIRQAAEQYADIFILSHCVRYTYQTLSERRVVSAVRQNSIWLCRLHMSVLSIIL